MENDGERLKRAVEDYADANGVSISQIADMMGLNRVTVYNHFRSKTIRRKTKLQYTKAIGIDWNTGPAEKIDQDPDGKVIPFIDAEVFATISPAMQDVVALRPETFVNIPMFSKGEFAVQVTGHSMKGCLNHGDWIVIRRITNKNFIVFGECYLVVTKSDNLKTVKFLNEHEDESKLWLSAYNSEQFRSQPIDKSEILEIYKVEGSLRRF